MKDPLRQFTKDAKQIRLDADAKKNIFASLQETMNAHPLPKRSFFLMHRYALASLAITVAGISTSYAAEFSNPGDVFYPVKIHINERILEASALSPEAKTDVKVTLVERRVKEIKTIIEDKSADEKEIHFIEEKIDEYTNEVSILVKEPEKKDKEKTMMAVARLDEALENHQETLISVTAESPIVATMMLKEETESESAVNESESREDLQEEINETLHAISVDIQQARVSLEEIIEEDKNENKEENIENETNEESGAQKDPIVDFDTESHIDISL